MQIFTGEKCGRAHLFAAVAGQVKRKNREKRYPHAGDDDVHRVEEGLPPHRDIERDVQVGLVAAGVKFLVPADRGRTFQSHCG